MHLWQCCLSQLSSHQRCVSLPYPLSAITTNLAENFQQSEAFEPFLLKEKHTAHLPAPKSWEPGKGISLAWIPYPAAQRAFDQEVLVTWVELGSTDGLEVRLQQALAQSRHWEHSRKQHKEMSQELKLQLDSTHAPHTVWWPATISKTPNFNCTPIIQKPLATITFLEINRKAKAE